jgi:Glycosyl hydrolase family 92/YCII-related domain
VKYLTFIRHSESHRQSGPPAALMEAMGKFVEKSLKDGVLVDTGGLLPSKDGVRVRLANGKITVMDGPFTESKEVIGGWAIAMGFYPLNPASAQYMIGSPLFKAVHLSLPNGNRFDISSPNNGPENVYVQSVKLNGKSLDIPVITYAQIEAGGKLEFVMGRQPSKWAANWRATPLAQQKSDQRVP